MMKSQNQVCDFLFPDHPGNTINQIAVITNQRCQCMIGGGCCNNRFFKNLGTTPLFRLTAYAVTRYMQGINAVAVFMRFDGYAKIDKLIDRADVAHGDQYPFFRCRNSGFRNLVKCLGQRNVLRPFLTDDGCEGTGYQNKENRSVQHTLIKQSHGVTTEGITDDNIVTDQDSCQSQCGMGTDQSKNQSSLVEGKTEDFLCYPGCKVFGYRSRNGDNQGNFNGFITLEKGLDIDQHTDADQKKGDKNGVADKLDSVHER